MRGHQSIIKCRESRYRQGTTDEYSEVQFPELINIDQSPVYTLTFFNIDSSPPAAAEAPAAVPAELACSCCCCRASRAPLSSSTCLSSSRLSSMYCRSLPAS